MNTNLINSELGKKSTYDTKYNPSLLFPIPRSINRAEIGVDDKNPGFFGVDVWTHYEVSWLNSKGKPLVAIGEISYPATSPNIIESKSMKLYFNSFNNTKLDNENILIHTIIKDLSEAVGAPVSFKLLNLNSQFNIHQTSLTTLIDDLDIICDTYNPTPKFLFCENLPIKESLYSNLLKSNCLVTNQPDWATIFIEYEGFKINHEGLLKYIISLRNHNEFHEQCVERIFNDIQKYCNPKHLTVYARYTRRGGLDINPYRTTNKNFSNINNYRLIRQ